MSSHESAATASSKSPSRKVRAATLARALTFLRVIAGDSLVRKAMGEGGYSDAESEVGFALARKVMTIPGNPVAMDNPSADAIAEIEAWRTTRLPIVQSALVRLYPEQERFVFDGLDPSNANEAVLMVSIVLERCSLLESGKGRKATHKADRAALAVLETRGFTKAERKRLAALVATVASHAAPLPEGAPIEPEERDARVLALRAWLVDWTNVAKVVIKRRDQLINLGIGKRRPKKKADAPSPAPAPAPPAAPVVAADRAPDSRAA